MKLSVFNGLPEPLDIALKNLDKFGGPQSHILYPNGWAFGAPRPLPGATRVASYGGICQPISWSIGRKVSRRRRGGLRTQWYHMIDIAPTVLRQLGSREPDVVYGR